MTTRILRGLRRTLRLLCVPMVLSVSACSGDSDAGGAAANYVEGAVVLAELGPVREGDGLTSGTKSLHVIDVARDGELVLVTVRKGLSPVAVFHEERNCADACFSAVGSAGGGFSESVVVSRDGGATWTSQPLVMPPYTPTGTGTWDRAAGFHVYEGRGVLVATKSGGDWSNYGAIPIDLETLEGLPAYSHDPTIEVFRTWVPVPMRAVGPWVSAWSQWTQELGVDAHNWHAYTLDLRTMAVTSDAALSSFGNSYLGGPPLPYLTHTATLNGENYIGVHDRGPYCSGTGVPWRSAVAVSSGCAERGGWPREVAEMVSLHPFRGQRIGVTGAYQGRAFVFVRDEDGGVLHDLGPGQPLHSAGLHETYSGLLRVLDPATGDRFIDIGPDGPIAFDVPATPCPDGAPCGRAARIVWLQDLNESEWLALYIVRLGRSPMQHDQLVAIRVPKQSRPLVVPPRPARDVSPIPFFPDAEPAGPLEIACQTESACLESQDFFLCVEEVLAGTYSCGRNVAETVDVSEEGACSAFSPAAFLGECTTEAPLCESEGVQCDGDTWRNCAQTGAPPLGQFDCSLVGQVCRESHHFQGGLRCAGETASEDVDCESGPYRVECHQGRYLSWCSEYKTRHWMDCQAIGADGCDIPGISRNATCRISPASDRMETNASPLEEACWAEASCLHRMGRLPADRQHALHESFDRCVARWASPLFATPDELAAFVAARGAGCEAIEDADPVGFWTHGQQCGSRTECLDPDLIGCSGSPNALFASTASCRQDAGTECRIDANGMETCIDDESLCATDANAAGCDALGRAYSCPQRFVLDCPAKGLVCVDDGSSRPSCVDPEWECAESGSACMGSTAVSCQEGRALYMARDCSRMGASCAEGECGDPERPRQPADDWSLVAKCLPDGRLGWWMRGPRILDCERLGGWCQNDANGFGWCEGL